MKRKERTVHAARMAAPLHLAGKIKTEPFDPRSRNGPCISYKPGELPRIVTVKDYLVKGVCRFCGRSAGAGLRSKRKYSCATCWQKYQLQKDAAYSIDNKRFRLPSKP